MIAANIGASLPTEYNLDFEHDFIGLYYEGDAQKICHQGDTQTAVPKADEHVVVRMYVNGPKGKETRN